MQYACHEHFITSPAYRSAGRRRQDRARDLEVAALGGWGPAVGTGAILSWTLDRLQRESKLRCDPRLQLSRRRGIPPTPADSRSAAASARRSASVPFDEPGREETSGTG